MAIISYFVVDEQRKKDWPMAYVLTDDSIHDLSPRAIELIFAVQPEVGIQVMRAMIHHPIMAEVAVRSFEEGLFKLNVTQAEEFERALSNRQERALLDRFTQVRKEEHRKTGATPLERALKASETKDFTGFTWAIRELDDIHRLHQELPTRAKLAWRIFNGLAKTKGLEVSEGAILLLASAHSEHHYGIQSQEILNAKLDVKKIALRGKNKDSSAFEYNHADIIVRAMAFQIPGADAAVRAALRNSEKPEETKAIFGKAFDDLVFSLKDSIQKEGRDKVVLNELQAVCELMTRLLPMGIYPSDETLRTPFDVMWTKSKRESVIERFQGPLSLCMPTHGMGVPGNITDELKPVSLWCLLANKSMSNELKEFARRGHDLSAANPSNGFTALHVAAGSNSSEIVSLLLQMGHDEKIKDADGKTPKAWWGAKSGRAPNDFDALVQVSKAMKAMDGILKEVAPKVGPEI